ncbi:GIY-YIG nuclease family protein [Rhodococcoides fascians]|uniref:GIY-YIG nuclease family protein n=1 Tax=Rhodococcoides fascians TaxID=1828 RepID=UPI00056AA3AC|nr:GIY-YIG nuclease family protein [Rhodococcus fascians]
MASTSKPRTAGPAKTKPKKKDLPADLVREFRSLFDEAKKATDNENRRITSAKWGVYAFYDYDGEPIYVGQTKESLATRLNRHLTNQRTDAVAMRILDVFEVAALEVWPLWGLEDTPKMRDDAAAYKSAQALLDAHEYSAYLKAIEDSKFGAILNEKIPPVSDPIELPESHRFDLVSETTRAERDHPDVRIARRAETLARLAAVAHERGEVSAGLRRVLVIQAVRLAFKAAERFNEAEGELEPDADAISVEGLIGSVLYPTDDEGEGE